MFSCLISIVIQTSTNETLILKTSCSNWDSLIKPRIRYITESRHTKLPIVYIYIFQWLSKTMLISLLLFLANF